MSDIDDIFEEANQAEKLRQEQADRERAQKTKVLDRARVLIETIIEPTLKSCKEEVAGRADIEIDHVAKEHHERLVQILE